MPVSFSRYLPSGANLRCNSVGTSSGMAETRNTFSWAKAKPAKEEISAQATAPLSARRRRVWFMESSR
jgi:hypothetical protein